MAKGDDEYAATHPARSIFRGVISREDLSQRFQRFAERTATVSVAGIRNELPAIPSNFEEVATSAITNAIREGSREFLQTITLQKEDHQMRTEGSGKRDLKWTVFAVIAASILTAVVTEGLHRL